MARLSVFSKRFQENRVKFSGRLLRTILRPNLREISVHQRFDPIAIGQGDRADLALVDEQTMRSRRRKRVLHDQLVRPEHLLQLAELDWLSPPQLSWY